MDLDFYSSLPSFHSFSEIFEGRHFRQVPQDWWMILTDVVGSTKAIEQGRYKEVNSAGSLAAMAISNVFGHMDFPFIFGGDGMTCLVPGDYIPELKGILVGIEKVVKQAFELDLRICLIPVSDLYGRQAELQIARWKVSNQYHQAIIEGNGVDIAEALMKTPGSPYLLDLDTTQAVEPNLTGYTCRWQDFPSYKDKTLALIVKFRTRNPAYSKLFLSYIDKLLGQSADHHPLTISKTKARFSNKNLKNETAIFAKTTTGLKAFFYRLTARFEILAVEVISRLGLPVLMGGKKNLSKVKEDNITSSDYKKYDNTLKLVVVVSNKQHQDLIEILSSEFQKGNIFWGLHASDRAMLTCLMQSKTGEEVHFVDAADGGYAYAAKNMKKQIQEMTP